MPRFDEPTWLAGYSPEGKELSLDDMMRALPLAHAARKQYENIVELIGPHLLRESKRPWLRVRA